MPPTQNINETENESSQEHEIKQEVDSGTDDSGLPTEDSDNIAFPNVSVGTVAYFQTGDGRCHWGKVIAKRKLYEYIVKNSKTGEVELIVPEDVMSIDCCNVGPPLKNTEINYYDCANEKEIVNCMEESGGLKGNKTNTELEKQLSAKAAAGVVLIPSFFVNQAPVRGYLKFATVLKAICSGFASGSEPVVCQQCANCEDEGECVRDGFCATSSDGASGGVSFPVFVGTLVGVTLIFGAIGLIQYQRQQRQMRNEVRGILAEYMPVDEKNDHAINTSLALQEDDGGGQFTIN